jgi:hypothetical protein
MDVDEYLDFTEMIKNPPDYLKLGEIDDPDDITGNSNDQIPANISVILNLVLTGCTRFPTHFIDPGISNGTLGLYSVCLMTNTYIYVTSANSDKEIKQLLQYAVPAPYGNISTGETLVDHTVRKCMQITGDKYQVDTYINPGTLQMVHQALYPQYEKIYISFNKINIYEEGGHFQKHVDTPKPGVIGTLLIFGDSKYTGGELVLHYNNDHSNQSEQMEDVVIGCSETVQYCAFHSNVPHSVRPVTSGYRVAISYYITSKPICSKTVCKNTFDGKSDLVSTLVNDDSDDEDEDQDQDQDQDQPEAQPEAQDVDQASKDIMITDYLNRSFGIVLYETYAQDENVLKGCDHVLVSRLQKLLPNATVEYYPVITSYTVETNYDEKVHRSASVYRLTEEDFNNYRVCGHVKQPNIAPSVRFYSYRQQEGGRLLHSEDTPYIEHVGNECQEGLLRNVYMNKAVIFRLPEN